MRRTWLFFILFLLCLPELAALDIDGDWWLTAELESGQEWRVPAHLEMHEGKITGSTQDSRLDFNITGVLQEEAGTIAMYWQYKNTAMIHRVVVRPQGEKLLEGRMLFHNRENSVAVRLVKSQPPPRWIRLPRPVDQTDNLAAKTQLYLTADDRGSALQLDADTWEKLTTKATHPQTVIAVTRLLYRYFRDEFDFLYLIADAEPNSGLIQELGFSGHATHVTNAIQGIGVGQIDWSADYGTSGQLKSILFLSFSRALFTGPSLHETMHTWGNFFIDELRAQHGSHWGFTDIGGYLGGWDPGTLESLGDNFYRVNNGTIFGTGGRGNNSGIYPPLELYLMGLVPPEEVPDIRIARDAKWVEPYKGVFTASGFDTLKFENLIQQKGARIPAAGDSQTEFRALAVIITRSPPDDSDRFRKFIDSVYFLTHEGEDDWPEYNFFEATGGRGRLKIEKLSESLRTD